MTPSADAIDALLPQTQCTQCGYAGCRPYAEAIAAGEASINRCPPGGAAGIVRLAQLLAQPPVPLDPECGAEGPVRLALIDEARCIGCTLCIQACPVDAIVGSAKRMHTVLLDACTGCELCVAPCPVDCIDLIPLDQLQHTGHRVSPRDAADWATRADRWRARLGRRRARLARDAAERAARLAQKAQHKLTTLDSTDGDAARKRAVIEAALARARARRTADRP
ncbi:MAG: electron transport complex subunit RsxB [Burkholderiales bacterium]|nr:electron transport complex subunit RsxB [Burkholderiales bacterium]